MPMNLKCDVKAAQTMCGDAKPIDLVHLSTQTGGDQNLEKEVLGIFACQAKIMSNLLSNSKDQETIRRTAHTLKGSSRGIGAFELADIAANIEAGKDQFNALQSELDRVVEYIKTIH